MPAPRTPNKPIERRRRGRILVAAVAMAVAGLFASSAVDSSTADQQEAKAAIVKADTANSTSSWASFRGAGWA